MKKSKMKWLGTLVMAVLLTSGISLNAQRPRGDQKPPAERPAEMDRGQKEERNGPQIPNLTEEQKGQLQALRLEEMKEAQPIQNLVAEKQARLNTLNSATNYDEKAVFRVIEEIGDLKTDLAKLKAGHQQKVKSVLTDEQVLFLNAHQRKGPEQNGRRRK